MREWTRDILGPGWEQTTLELGRDDEGPVVATLVRVAPEPPTPDPRPSPAPGPTRPAAPTRPAVLYVHGFNDYFFQAHLADQWRAHGYDFYALDLRKCGRSLRPWQTPHFCTDLTEYAPELTGAARLIKGALGHPRLVVMGHSAGGLTTSLWAHSLRREAVVDALVLNSPWFDLNAPWFSRVVSTRVLDALGPLDPMRVVSRGSSAYSENLHVSKGGRWDYDLDLKSPTGLVVRAGWLRAVRRGQARLAKGLDIAAPVLVCTALASGPNTAGNPDRDRQDTILDIRHIWARAQGLGPDVTVVRIPDGIHDLALSADPSRSAFFDATFRWLAGLSAKLTG